MKRKLLFCSLFVLFFARPFVSEASHIMGGNLSYTYAGYIAGINKYAFDITLKVYRYCAPGSSQLPLSMDMGAYLQDTANPTASKVRNSIWSLPLVESGLIQPPNANDSCTFLPSVCVEEGIYQLSIQLDPSAGGYHLIVDRCCRNGNIGNLLNPGDAGMAFYAFIPPTAIANSAPVFGQAPVPFICAGDTVSYDNSAFDPDGDSLVYSFQTPFNGISNTTNPAPTPPITYNFPIAPVTYAPGFSVTSPFGAGGYASIDATTGLTYYLSQNVAFYVVAVQVEEYRNSALIGVTRRDLQLIFITCPANPPPNISAVTSPHLQDTIIEGQTICFPITYTDPNGDSLYLTYTGNIFNSAIVNPPATLTNASGLGTVTAQFCWTTSCNQGSATPYQFNVAVNDNGCPAKTTNNAYSILVIPFTTPPITGTDSLCNNAKTGIPYTVAAGLTGTTYNWIITGGSQASGGTTNSITVNWTTINVGTVKCVATSPDGCVGDTVTKTIYIKPVPTANAGANVAFCSGATVGIGTGSTAGYTYAWTPSTGVSSTSISNPNVTLTNTGAAPVTTNYIVTTTLNGCTNRDTVAVTVNPAAVATAGPNQSVCSGTLVNLGTTTTPGYTYAWTPSTGLSSTTISNPVYNHLNAGSAPDTIVFTVTVTNSFLCTATSTVQVIVRPVPIANAGTDVIFCSGQSAPIGTGSTGGYTYAWSPVTGLSGSTLSNPNVTLTNPGSTNQTFNYIVTATWFGCTAKDTVVVTVKPNPVSNAGADQNLCSGDTIPLGTTSTPGYVYAWTPSTGLTSTNTSNPNVIVSNPGPGADTLTYTVTTTLNGCTTTDVVQIIVNALPNVSGSVNPTSICAGDPSTLTGSGATTYSWAELTNPGVSIGAGTSITVNPTVTTSYIVTGTNGVNCSNQDTVTVTVNPLPAVQAVTPQDSICEGDSITITGTGASTYSWALLSNPGTPISSNPSIFVGPASTISYIVTGTDGNGCKNKDTIQIFVNAAPDANQILGNISVCPGVTGVSYWVTPTTTGSTYAWGISGGLLASGQGNDSVFVDWDSSGTGLLTVIETTAAGCPSDTLQLAVNINVFLTPVEPAGLSPLCANQALNITYTLPSTPQSTYTWHVQGGNITGGNTQDTVVVDWNLTGPSIGAIWYEELSITVDTVCYGISDTLYVTINPSPNTSPISGDPAVCVFDSTGSFTVVSDSGSTYVWNVSSGSILSGTGTDSITATWGTSGTYTVYVIETNFYGCPGDTVSRTVLVNPLPNAFAGNDIAICFGDTTTLAASGGINYEWTPSTGLSNTAISNPQANPASTITYVVLVTDTNGCQKTDDILVTVNPLPPADAGTDAAVCLGLGTTLNASGGVNYQWIPATGLSSTTGANPVASPTQTTTYTVTVTDGNNCSKTDSVVVTVNALPVAVASVDSIICSGSTIALSASGGISFLWTPATGLDNSTAQNPNATLTSPVTYTVTVTDGNGCTDTEDVVIDVNPQPAADFEIVDSVDCQGVTSYFINKTTDGIDYLWDFGDGTTSTEFEPVHFFPFTQRDSISLTAVNNDCADTKVIASPVVSLEEYLKNVPNVFTPNGDNMNDCFGASSVGKFGECASFWVYNRWGKLMYESTSGDECWDGTNMNNGEYCDEGVYFYIMKVLDVDLKGTVHLIK